MNDTIISTENLTKRFASKGKTPDVEAVRELSIEVRRGELVAFLGPNGAGKTTSLRMLTTLVPPTSGTARVVGHDIITEQPAVRAAIGYVGQGTSGSPAQRVRDELVSQGRFYGMSRTAAAERAEELVASLDITGFADQQVQNLSGGQKRRVDIAIGLMNSPTMLFLDEPSTGLDPQSRANLWRHILDLRTQHGTTVFLTTHYLEEADRYAERVMVMDSGQVIADDTARALKTELAGDAVTIRVASEERSRAGAVVGQVLQTEVTVSDDGTLTSAVPDGARLLPLALGRLAAEGLAVEAATCVPPTLDDVFLALTGRTLREAHVETDLATAAQGGTR
ncbi:MAG: ATP-binding cassette domain-containing protein [Actinomycetales bacterium]|nr:ATP-binding cassette domain-containing protein [Actinomycetales bacterium]